VAWGTKLNSFETLENNSGREYCFLNLNWNFVDSRRVKTPYYHKGVTWRWRWKLLNSKAAEGCVFCHGFNICVFVCLQIQKSPLQECPWVVQAVLGACSASMLRVYGCVFCSFLFCLSTCVGVCQCLQVQGPLRECIYQALPCFHITTHNLCPFQKINVYVFITIWSDQLNFWSMSQYSQQLWRDAAWQLYKQTINKNK